MAETTQGEGIHVGGGVVGDAGGGGGGGGRDGGEQHHGGVHLRVHGGSVPVPRRRPPPRGEQVGQRVHHRAHHRVPHRSDHIFLLTKGKQSHILRFDEQLFFIYVLPPIIFNAGYGFCLCRFQVKKKQFFHNFMTIMSFGVFGVFISVAIVSAALGAIFSSTDTVCTLQVINQDETPRLYSLVFGEGVVNDATAVVLFNAIKNLNIGQLKGGVVLKVRADFLYLFATSTILGISIGLSTAYVLKALYLGRHSTDREVALMALMAYLSYMLAALLDLSGILTVFFCGIVMSHYAWHNVTANSRITTKHIFATLSFIAETFIFLYVGMDALDIDKWKTSKASFKTSISIFGIIILLVLIGRAAFVFPISILSNNMSGSSERMPITFKHQVVIWWAGLMRGAVSIALAYNQFTFSGVTSDPVHVLAIEGNWRGRKNEARAR
ncbi:hypothetical protein PVAP13_4NG220400 [Panicum virgatum]|uniref:Cation/H+ exchanger transmembrane domain-containing protein n=1 Tax=Panicum virgatum TaxID=38727 RepID=A0A8T0T820_PANVG|nr:hypothetical protein PVAP13_4NG220400 [Panicum virgatum]